MSADAPTDVSPETLAEIGRTVSRQLLAEHRAHAAKQAAEAICEAVDWSREANRPTHGDLMRRRYPPTGDPELWVRHGPAGPPPKEVH